MKTRDLVVSSLTFLAVLFLLSVVLGAPTPAQAQAIQVLSADPNTAEQGTVNLNVRIKGKGFKNGAKAEFLVTKTSDPGGVRVNSTTFVDETTLTANIDVADAAVLSLYDIRVKNPDGRGGKGTELFSVTKKQDASCTLPPPVPEGGYCFASAPGMPGCLDTTFGGGTGRVLGPRNLKIQGLTMQTVGAEQRITAVGSGINSSDPCVSAESKIVRYRSDGTPDPTFGNGGVVSGLPLGIATILGSTLIAVQPDNKLVVVGQASVQLPASRGKKPATVNVPAVARYNQDGSLDTSFGNAGVATVPNGSTTGYLSAVALRSDGKIVATGAYGYNLAVIRLNPDGTIDTSFNGTGRFVFSSNRSEGNAIAIQRIGSEERIVVAGQMLRTYAYWTGIVVRLTSAGLLDNTFGDNGLVEAVHPPPLGGGYNGGEFYGVAVDSSNRIVAAGSMNLYALQLARYDELGNLDLAFGEGGYVLPPMRVSVSGEFANGIVIQPDGHILTAGVGYLDTGTGDRPLMIVRRFTPDGADDFSFGDAGSVIETFTDPGNGNGMAIVLQGDGKVVVGGIGPNVLSGNIGYFGAVLARFWIQ